MENNIQSEYFGGMHYLQRLDKLLIAFNHATIQGDINLMYDCIHSFFEELSPYMNKEELDDNKSKAEYLHDKLYDADKEQADNKRKLNKINNYGSRGVKLSYDNFIEAKRDIRTWRIELQKIQKKYGLLMRDAEDPAAAMQRGLSE